MEFLFLLNRLDKHFEQTRPCHDTQIVLPSLGTTVQNVFLINSDRVGLYVYVVREMEVQAGSKV